MSRSLTTTLGAHSEGDLTIRVVNGFFSVLPFAPSWTWPGSLAEGAARLDPSIASRVAARAEALSLAKGPQAALGAFDFLDKGDAGIALFSGLRGAVKAARGAGVDDALEMDPQQAADAGLKAAGLAYAAYALFEGPLDDRANALISTETGRALLTWYVACDVVLPFADNVVAGGVDVATRLIDEQAANNLSRIAAIAGPDIEGAAGMLDRLGGTIKGYASQAAAFAQPLSAYAQQSLPGVLGAADKVAGVAATGVDALSAYRCLGASLVAEVCLARALAEVRVEIEAEHAAAEAANIAAAAVEQARVDAERQARAAEHARAEAERASTRQREDYTLDTPEDAASLRNNPVKFTRSAELEPRADAKPTRAGCMGCGAAVFVLIFASTAAGLAAWV